LITSLFIKTSNQSIDALGARCALVSLTYFNHKSAKKNALIMAETTINVTR